MFHILSNIPGALNASITLVFYCVFLYKGIRGFINSLPSVKNVFFQAFNKDVLDQSSLGFAFLFEVTAPFIITDLFGGVILTSLSPIRVDVFSIIRIVIAVIGNLTFALRASLLGALLFIKFRDITESLKCKDINSALFGSCYLLGYLGIILAHLSNPLNDHILGHLTWTN